MNPLSNISKRSRLGALYRAARELAPLRDPKDPDLADPWYLHSPSIKTLADKVLKTLGYKRSEELSEKTRGMMLGAINKQLSDTLLAGPEKERILSQLGSTGLLRSEHFEIKCIDNIRKSERGSTLHWNAIPYTEIQEAVRSPDYIEHTSVQGSKEASLMESFVAKHFIPKDHRLGFTLVIHAKRSGKVLTILEVWKAYDGTVDFTKARGAIAFLEAFVTHYGEDIQIGSLPPKKIVTLDEYLDLQQTPMTKFKSKKGALTLYSIDKKKYLRELEFGLRTRLTEGEETPAISSKRRRSSGLQIPLIAKLSETYLGLCSKLPDQEKRLFEALFIDLSSDISMLSSMIADSKKLSHAWGKMMRMLHAQLTSALKTNPELGDAYGQTLDSAIEIRKLIELMNTEKRGKGNPDHSADH